MFSILRFAGSHGNFMFNFQRNCQDLRFYFIWNPKEEATYARQSEAWAGMLLVRHWDALTWGNFYNEKIVFREMTLIRRENKGAVFLSKNKNEIRLWLVSGFSLEQLAPGQQVVSEYSGIYFPRSCTKEETIVVLPIQWKVWSLCDHGKNQPGREHVLKLRIRLLSLFPGLKHGEQTQKINF